MPLSHLSVDYYKKIQVFEKWEIVSHCCFDFTKEKEKISELEFKQKLVLVNTCFNSHLLGNLT